MSDKNKRDVKINLAVPEVLRELGYSGDFLEVYMEIEDSKDIYNLLSTSNDILDWNFIDPEEMKEDEVKISSELLISLRDYNELATYLEAVWRLAKSATNPMKFGDADFEEALREIYNQVGSSSVSVEHVAFKTTMEFYYDSVDFEEAKLDAYKKIKKLWENGLSTYNTIIEVVVKLYRK